MDPRIERAAQALCALDGHEPAGEAWEAALVEARRFVRVLDAVTPRQAPDTGHLRRSGDMLDGEAAPRRAAVLSR